MRPAPPPQPPAPMGAAKNKRAHACAPGRRTDRTQRSLVSTNQSGMGGHAPHGQHNASDARFVACSHIGFSDVQKSQKLQHKKKHTFK